MLSDALDLLATAGIPIAPHLTTSSQEAACAWAREAGYPVTLKIDVPSVIHKTDINGVTGRIDNEDTLKKTFERLQNSARTRTLADRILVQSWVDGALEMILGAKTDESFGPVILLGFGGIYTETIKDTVLRLLPLTETEAQTLPLSLKGAPLLRGLRGQPARDLPALADALLRLSQLMMDFPQITGVDINPLLLLPESHGLVAVDARIVM